MERETAEVRRYVDGGSRRELEIANFWADGPGTPTPPGHWNFIAAPYVQQADMSEVRAARAFALLNMALHDAAVACWEVKYFYFNPRPTQMDAVVPVSKRRAAVRGAEGRSVRLAAVRRHPLPLRSRDRQGARQAFGGYTVSFARTDGAQ